MKFVPLYGWMTLREYHENTGVPYAFIARKCGVSGTMISQSAAGSFRPSFELALKIEQATNNLVGRENWYPPRRADVTITIGGTSL